MAESGNLNHRPRPKPRKPPTYNSLLGDDDDDVECVAPAPKKAKPGAGLVTPPLRYDEDGEPLPWTAEDWEQVGATAPDDAGADETVNPRTLPVVMPSVNEIGNKLYATEAKGRVIAVPQWLREFIGDRLKGLPSRSHSNVAALYLVGAQLCWWGRIKPNGEPRATVGRRAPNGDFLALVNRSRLAKHCGITRDVASNTIRRLEQIGLISTDKGGKSGRIFFVVNWGVIYAWFVTRA